MESALERASPRRGSLSSLHRQSSGSLPQGTKLSSPSSNVASTTNVSNLSKDLDKFTRYFIIKTMQVIVQSRTNVKDKVKTDCKPNGNDWFNINITDIPEVSEGTKAALDAEWFSVKNNWRIACEISLKTADGNRIILEHWIISNKSLLNQSTGHAIGHASPKSLFAIRSSTSHLTSSNGCNTVPLSTINSSSNPTRIRSTFANSSRTRLNSIDDFPDDNGFGSNKLLACNNENLDIRSSTSCFSLTAAAGQPTQNNETNGRLCAFPSTNSLNNNLTQDQGNSSSSSQHGSSKTNVSSSIYTIYNKMSLLLKTIMTTAHIIPAFRLASRVSQTESCVISYRIRTIPSVNGSMEDIEYVSNSDSPNRRSSSCTSSFGSANIRDFVASDDSDRFCPMMKLGSIRTEINELTVALCYRVDLRSSKHLLISPRSRGMYNRMLDDDCILAAKQLLAGNEDSRDSRRGDWRKNFHDVENHKNSSESLDFLDQPLRPAFANDQQKSDKKVADELESDIIESTFENLLLNNNTPQHDDLVDAANEAMNSPPTNNNTCESKKIHSEPIQVPSNRKRIPDVCQNLSSGSTPKSLIDSYVMVDLNPPFASEEQHEIKSFFHGPSPSFNSGYDSLKDVDELTNQLAVIEANASQIDDFVDNICVSENEEEDEQT